jgi:hypothetical protein
LYRCYTTGAKPEWKKLEMRPVKLKKGGVKLQVVKYDQRQVGGCTS